MHEYSDTVILNRYWNAYFQDYYHMTINYEEGQSISFCEKSEIETESILDLFPPMLFCKAANDRSRQYICAEDRFWRKGITVDHPFVKWLLDNANLLIKPLLGCILRWMLHIRRIACSKSVCLCRESSMHGKNPCAVM